jgi:hypothetical protein
MLSVMALGYILLHSLLGGTLLSHSSWDSYTLQALAWRDGRLGLGQDYPWLELAVYQGDWYVSFPPLPTLVMLPLTFIFGQNTPNNLVMALYAMGTAALAYFALLYVLRPRAAAFTALFTVWGSNMLWMSTNGGVWFQAQALNMLLLTAMALCALKGRRKLAYALVALAVGCRPFSIVAFLALFVYFAKADRDKGISWPALLRAQAKCLIAPVFIAAAYMAYNYARFGNVLEFGHNYLPEFTGSAHGQFWPGYIPANLYNLFLRPVAVSGGLALAPPYFDGFMFYVANPVFLLLFIRVYKGAVRGRISPVQIALLLCMLINILLLCAHKTLGGWQFGARYTVDFIPLALLYLILDGEWRLSRPEIVIMAFGLMFNAYGALAMTYLYS